MDLIQPSPGYAYYRPLFLLWTSLVFQISKAHAAVVFHFSAVALHLANIALLFRLLRKLRPLKDHALASSLIFGLLPFHYQAILTPAFSLHIWQAFFFLSAGIIYTARNLPAHLRHLLLSALFLAAVLNHETAILMGVFLAGVDFLSAFRSRHWFPYLIAGIGYALLYQILPRGTLPPGTTDVVNLIERGRFALQALAFPLIPGLTQVLGVERSNWSLSFALAWIALSWIARPEASRRMAGSMGVLFFLLAIAPSALLLPTGYFLHGQRLLYLGSIGIAIFWGSRLGGSGSSPARLRTLRRFALAGVALMAWGLSLRQVDLHARALEPIGHVREISSSAPIHQAVWVNLPEWLAYERRMFPVGSEGALVFGGHLLPGTIFAANSSIRPCVELLRIDVPFNRPRGYAFQASGQPVEPAELVRKIEQADLVLFTVYREAGPQTAVFIKSEVTIEALQIIFSEGLILRGGAACRRGSEVQIDLVWERSGPLAPSISLALHVVDAEGRILGQADGPPWYGAIPFDQIPLGSRLFEMRSVRMTPAAQPAAIRMALYNWQNGQRVSVRAHPADVQVQEGSFIYLPLRPCLSIPSLSSSRSGWARKGPHHLNALDALGQTSAGHSKR
ncbi:MAG TPA: hypothetical protein VNK89_07465 [Thermoflexus sp.]|nr:hypothetical protein [Thermoflexus sp.]